ncbi:MAG TPA: hypothetical protein VKB58_10595 [Terriglobales bacterium]|jgi:hypothetical protein|nr:hypothetical protein [Terriglobales bacterium]
MSKLKRTSQELYSETEAAAALGISIVRLRELLDKYVFTGGNVRPDVIEFTSSDLLLLGYWNSGAERHRAKIISMPKPR